jgi:hypothetical protein
VLRAFSYQCVSGRFLQLPSLVLDDSPLPGEPSCGIYLPGTDVRSDPERLGAKGTHTPAGARRRRDLPCEPATEGRWARLESDELAFAGDSSESSPKKAESHL